LSRASPFFPAGAGERDAALILERLKAQLSGRGNASQALGRALGRRLTDAEIEALFKAGAKGTKFDPEVHAVLDRIADSSARARAEVLKPYDHSSDSARPYTSRKTGNTVHVEGQPQKGTSAGHKERMVQVAAHALDDEQTVAVFIDRPLEEALLWLERQPGVTAAQSQALQRARNALGVPIPPDAAKGAFPVKEPDVVRIWKDSTGAYKIDITEVYSPPGQTRNELAARISKAFKLLPNDMRGNKFSLPPVEPE
jgi:hypothetical protein